ncbi:MAG: glycoside hydrolase family 5 protein [Dactylosporangium sp.]|nr:glycoside hydrolase family 5 protein [Dactylosporangium sp.]NNJ61501.1 glycoside hydrolase family 5 protein [Dactylosporangium sp.]
MVLDGTARRFRRGVNFGNALDSAREAPAGLLLGERHLDVARDAGFDLIRLPVRWSAWADPSAPHLIEPGFFDRVDLVINGALDRELTVVVNVHHYDELQRVPDEHEDRFVALWRQISARYAGYPTTLWFELLNEPRDAMTARRWNRLLSRTLAVVRERNRDRTVVIGPVQMNGFAALPDLELPADDHVAATVHYYEPMTFTHQGAAWTPGADRWRGTTWGSDADRDAVRSDLARAAAWAHQRGVELFVGEFGTYDQADLASRVAWTRYVRWQAEQLGLSWCYWDFGTDFGVYDPGSGSWREPLRQALLDPG